MKKDAALLLLRVTTGGLLAGHGAQKLFGWYGGHGLKGTAGWLESMGMKPGHRWAAVAGLSELGGALMALGLGGPLGPIATMGAMGMATATVHWGKPIWVSEGGAELPVINIAVAGALALTGPGRYSLDRVFGIKVPWWLGSLALAATAGGIAFGLVSREEPPKPQEQAADTASQGEVTQEERVREVHPQPAAA